MDPNATMIAMLEAFRSNALQYTSSGRDGRLFDNAREAAQDLRGWIASGGFEPDWTREAREVYRELVS